MLEESQALVVLNMLPGVGPGRKRVLVESFGSAGAALSASREELSRVPGIGGRVAELVSGWERHCDLAGELDLARRSGVTLVTEADESYPPLLREIHDPPVCLYVLGSLECLRERQRMLAMVGSRHTTLYGMRMAESLASEAAQSGWTVVSGLARGIDTASHQATLRAGGTTVAVVGGGMLCLYPQENLPLARRMAESGGAVVSESPMRARPDRRSFPMRNRIISGMCRGTLVVQAGLRSGSLITAAQALEQGRAVFAVPGPADVEQSRGCHALLRDGARLTETFADVLDELSPFGPLRRQAVRQGGDGEGREEAKETKRAAAELQMSGLELKLWEKLADGEADLDELIVSVDEEAGAVMACLLTMELRRLVRQLPGKRVARNDV